MMTTRLFVFFCLLLTPLAGLGQPAPQPKDAAAQRRDLPEGNVARLGADRRFMMGSHADLTPDERTMVVMFDGFFFKKNVLLVDVATQQVRRRLDIVDARHFAIARDKPIMIVGNTKRLELWDLAKEKLLRHWTYPTTSGEAHVLHLAISPNGKQIVANITRSPAHFGYKILRWHADSPNPPAVHRNEWTRDEMYFSADGRRFFAVSPYWALSPNDKIITAWDAKTGAQVFRRRLDLWRFGLSPCGTKVVGLDEKSKQLKVVPLDPENKEEVVIPIPADKLALGMLPLHFTPDSKHILLFDEKYVARLWDIAENKEALQFEKWGWDVALRPGRRYVPARMDGWFWLWDAATGKLIRFTDGQLGAVRGLAYAPDGKTLASHSMDTIVLFDSASGAELRRWIAHKDNVTQIAYAPDGKLLASASKDGTIALWDPQRGQERQRLSAQHEVLSIAFGRDGKTLTAICSERTLQTWDLDKGIVVRRDVIAKAHASPTLSPNGQYVAAYEPNHYRLGRACGSPLLFLNVSANRFRPPLDFGKDCPFAFTFSADSKLLAVSTSKITGWSNGPLADDLVVRLWETATQREIVRFSGHGHKTMLLAISPDNRFLVHGAGWHSTDTALIFHDLSLAETKVPAAGAKKALSARINLKLLVENSDYHRGGPIFSAGITCLAFSPDSKYLATGGSDGLINVWDVEHFIKRPALPLVQAKAADLWDDLASDDAGKAYRAMTQLETMPQETVALLRKHLRPMPRIDEQTIRRYIRDLDADNFRVREKALAALLEAGEPALPLVRQERKQPASLEAKLRLDIVLEQNEFPFEKGPARRVYRALTVLERIGNEGARRVLEELAQGAPDTWLTVEARLILARWQE